MSRNGQHTPVAEHCPTQPDNGRAERRDDFIRKYSNPAYAGRWILERGFIINTILLVPSIQNSRVGQQLKFSFRRFHTKMTADNVREWVKYGQKNFTDAGMMEKFKHIMLEEQLATEQDFRDMQTAEKSKGLSELVSAWKEEIRNGNTKEAEEVVKQDGRDGIQRQKSARPPFCCRTGTAKRNMEF